MSAHQSRSASTGLSTENRHEVIETIANYAPACLSATRWSHCADAVRAAVAAAKPPTVKHARLWLTHLCQFLSSPCGWDGTVTPDLAALLTEATIRAYGCNSRGAGNTYTTACNRRNNLRRIARASGWLAPTSTPFAKTTTTALRAELLAAAKQPLPVAVIAQAWESRNNRVLPEAAFRPVVAALLVTSDVNATPPSGGTFWSPASMRVLAKATDQMVKGCEASVKKPNPTGALTAAGKKLSRQAVLRHAKANLAAGKAHRDGPTLTDPPQQDSVPDDVAAAIEAYQPEKAQSRHVGGARRNDPAPDIGIWTADPRQRGEHRHSRQRLPSMVHHVARAGKRQRPAERQGTPHTWPGRDLLAVCPWLERVPGHPAGSPATCAEILGRLRACVKNALPAGVDPVHTGRVRPFRGLGASPAHAWSETKYGLHGRSWVGCRT